MTTVCHRQNKPVQIDELKVLQFIKQIKTTATTTKKRTTIQESRWVRKKESCGVWKFPSIFLLATHLTHGVKVSGLVHELLISLVWPCVRQEDHYLCSFLDWGTICSSNLWIQVMPCLWGSEAQKACELSYKPLAHLFFKMKLVLRVVLWFQSTAIW